MGIVELQISTAVIATQYNIPTPGSWAPPVIEKKKEKKKE